MEVLCLALFELVMQEDCHGRLMLGRAGAGKGTWQPDVPSMTIFSTRRAAVPQQLTAIHLPMNV